MVEETESTLRLTKWQMLGAKEAMWKEWYREYILRSKIATVDQKSTMLIVVFIFGIFFKVSLSISSQQGKNTWLIIFILRFMQKEVSKHLWW